MEWLEAREQILLAAERHRDPTGPPRILLVCGAARHDQTCPGEMSKTFRLVQMARAVIEGAGGFECDLLDLSMLTAQYGRQLLPCKACVSTAMPAGPTGSDEARPASDHEGEGKQSSASRDSSAAAAPASRAKNRKPSRK